MRKQRRSSQETQVYQLHKCNQYCKKIQRSIVSMWLSTANIYLPNIYSLPLFFKIFIYLASPRLTCGMWDPFSQPGIEPRSSALGVSSLSRWLTMEVTVFEKSSLVIPSKSGCFFHPWLLSGLSLFTSSKNSPKSRIVLMLIKKKYL